MSQMENQLDTRWGRFKTYLDLLFVDHAIFRVSWRNFGHVGGELYRSNNPMQRHIRQLARKGFRTVVNLRGANRSSWYYLEEEACRRYGVELVNFPVKSRDVPAKDVIHGARDLFAQIQYPALMHCKSGADRVGFMGALYLLLHEGRPLEEAMRQLHWSYGHVKTSKTGILDHFFETYARAAAAKPIDFLDWVDREYDPDALKGSFKPRLFGTTLGDVILRRE